MLKKVVFYLARYFDTERSEISKFHDSMIFFTSFSDVYQCLYLCDDQIFGQKAAEQVPRNASKPTVLGKL